MKKINLTSLINTADRIEKTRSQVTYFQKRVPGMDLLNAEEAYTNACAECEKAKAALIAVGGGKYVTYAGMWGTARYRAESDNCPAEILEAASAYDKTLADKDSAWKTYGPLKRANENLEDAKTGLQDAENDFAEAAAPVLAEINAAEGRSIVRQITPENIVDAVNDIEKALSISKKAMTGTFAVVDYHAQKFPAAYRYIPESTHFTVDFNGRAWYLTAVKRCVCGTRRYNITLSETAKAAVLDRVGRGE